jgi:hypothetical protein
VFVGVKMLLIHSDCKIDSLVSLLVVLGLLTSGVAASLVRPGSARQDTERNAAD